MAQDIRLDFIDDIKPEFIEKMTEVRQGFIEMDSVLMSMADLAEDWKMPAASRSVALARTHQEIALQYMIKSLCILGENK